MTARAAAVRSAVAIGLVIAGAAAGLVAAGGRADAPPARGLRADLLPADLDGSRAPRIALRDARGAYVDSDRLGGRPYLVTFLYTHCTDVCPVIGSELADAFRQLGPDAPRAAALAVSVDPRGDTPARARRWTAERGLPPEFRYLLGTPRDLAPVWRAWYVTHGSRPVDPTSHDASVWLVDARGRLRGRWPGGEAIAPADIAHDLRALIAEVS
jgi:protein SCO1/2